MNNLTRVLMGSASAAAILFGVHTGAQADTVSPIGGGTITYGGTLTDDTATGGGAEIDTLGNDSVDIAGVTIDKTTAGPGADALFINNTTGSLNVTFSGTGSSLREESGQGGAALDIGNLGNGATTLDTTGSTGGNIFLGQYGISVTGNDYARVVLGADNIDSNVDGAGTGSFGLYVNAASTDITTNAVIGGNLTHSFDYGIYTAVAGFSTITLDSAASVTASTADIYADQGSVTISNYGTLGGAGKGILVTGGATANINLFAGSTTGDIDLTGDNAGGGSTVSLYTGMGTDNVGLTDLATGAVQQAPGTLAAASFGTITGSGFDELDLHGAGDDTPENGASGAIDLSSTGGISGFGAIGKYDSGVWTFYNGNNDAATNSSAGIFLEEGTIAAASAGAFGSGTIHVDNSGGFSLIDLAVTGTYGNDISLNVSGATLSTGAQIVVINGRTATLSGAITSASANQTLAFIGAGTAVLTNANNAWTGGTQISGGGTVSIGALDNIGTGGITLGGSSSHGTLQYTGTGAEESTQGLTIKPGGGTFDITDAGGELGFTGDITGNGTIMKISDGRLDLYHGDLTGHPGYTNFTGAIDVEAGSLYLSSNGSLTQGNNLTVASGALFVSGQGNQTIGVLSGAGEVDTGDGVFKVGSGVTSTAQSSTFSGQIDSGADSTFEKTGAGTLVLGVTTSSAFNNIVIDQGTLALGASGDISNSNALSLTGASAIFDASTITSATPTVHNLSGVAGSQVKFGSKGLTVDQPGSTTFAGVISGSASFPDSFEVTGGGTLTLTGVNTYFAETIIESGTTLALAGNGSIADSSVDDLGTFDISATNNGATIAGLSGTGLVNLGAKTLTLANASNSFDGVIQGTGGLTLTGGTLTLSNVNTYSGTTEIGVGAGLTLTGNGSIANSSVDDLGSLNVTGVTTAAGATIASLTGNGTVEFGAATLTIANGAGEFSGVIDGTGGLTLAGGAETLSGANTYTGTTTVTGGVLTAGTSTALNNTTVTLAGGGLGYGDGVNLADAVVLGGSNAQLQVNTGTATQSGAITETGGPRDLDKTGNGTLVVTTAVAYTGTTDVEAGTLRAGVANAFASSSNIIVAQGATLDLGGFAQSTPELSGSGDLDLGSSQFTVGSDNASTTFSGVLSGTGSLVKTGTGTLTLSGANTYSGGTTIQGGTIDAENDQAFGTGSVTLEDPVIAYGNGISIANNVILAANDAQLQVATGTATQAGVISQTGGARPLEKIGAGTLVLSATNTYTGATTVTAGTLDVTGSIASSSLTTVKSGATLTGNGTVGSASIASGATFTPTGTMNVHGNLTYASGSNYVVSLSPAGASQANVTGTATLGGAAVKANYGAGSYINKQYTIVTAGTVSGTFGSVTSANLPANFSQSLSYDGQHAYLDLALSYVPPSPPAYGNGLTGNQNRVANTLVNYFNTTGGIPTAFGTLSPASLTAVSGEVAVAAGQASKDAQEDFLNAMLSPSLTGRSAASEMTADASGTDVKPAQANGNPWHVWGGAFGGGRSTDGSASVGSSSTNAHNYGAAGGVDYIFNPGLVAGLAVSGGNSNFSVSHAAGSGKSDIYQIGAYAHQDIGTAGYITGALAYGSQDVTTHRTVDQSGVTGTYRGHYSSDSWSGRLEAGWRFQSGDWTGFTPYIAWQATSDSVPGYSEKTVSGSNTFALNYGGTDFDTSRGEIGLRADHTFQMDDGVMMLRGHAAWADNFQLDHAIDAGFQTLPGTGFTVQGAAEGRSVGLAGVSGEWKWNSGMSLVGSVDGAFSNKSTAYVASGAVRYTW